MSRFVSIDPRKRNRILLKAIYFNIWHIMKFSLIPAIVILIVSLIKDFHGTVSNLEFIIDSFYFFVGTFWLVFSTFRVLLISYLKKLKRRVAWSYIDIQNSRIYMRMDWEEFYIEKDTISELRFASEDERKIMVHELWTRQVNLNVLKLATNGAYLFIVLETIQEAEEMLRELHEFYTIEGYEGEREKELNNLIEKLYRELLSIEENIRNNGITESEGIIDEFNKIILASDNEYQEILAISRKIENSYIGDRLGLKCVQKKLKSLYDEQKKGNMKLSKVFWNELLKILFKGNDTAARVWGFLVVLDEQNLHFNKMYYVRLLETYGIGPLTATEITMPEMTEYCYAIYKHAVVLLNADTAQQVVYSIINNVYERMMHGNVENKDVYDNYFAIIKKYVQMPEEMLVQIPQFNPGKYNETRKEVLAFFMNLFEKLPYTNWSTAKCRFNMNSKRLSPKTEDQLISKTKTLLNF